MDAAIVSFPAVVSGDVLQCRWIAVLQAAHHSIGAMVFDARLWGDLGVSAWGARKRPDEAFVALMINVSEQPCNRLTSGSGGGAATSMRVAEPLDLSVVRRAISFGKVRAFAAINLAAFWF